MRGFTLLAIYPLQRKQEFYHLNSDLLFTSCFQDENHEKVVGKLHSLQPAICIYFSIKKEVGLNQSKTTKGKIDFSQIVMFKNRWH